MQRRDFIHLSAYTAAALALPFIAGCRRKPGAVAQPLLFSHLVSAKTITATGEAYRKTRQHENDKTRLTELLLTGNGIPAAANEATISLMLDNKVKDDFKTGRIIVVKGWVLSVTEARQCALFSILQS